jgi:hypothetical protein
MELEKRVNAFVKLGEYLHNFIQADAAEREENFPDLERLIRSAASYNPWFTRENILHALSSTASMLDREALNTWARPYLSRLERAPGKTVGVVMAGNIPMVGFHDMLCVLVSGNILQAKVSSQDPALIPFLAEKLIQLEPQFEGRISFSAQLKGFDGVIATGSNNTARYFEHYFGKYPHIIRKNRNSVAVLSGEESKEELQELGKDIFTYFGLGCRNVSRLFVPAGYDFGKLYRALEPFSGIVNHHKYANNYDYNKAIYLVNQAPFLDNGFLLLKEDSGFSSPISVLYHSAYPDLSSLPGLLDPHRDSIQCIVSSVVKGGIGFGKAQQPGPGEYADGVDTLEFLAGLS